MKKRTIPSIWIVNNELNIAGAAFGSVVIVVVVVVVVVVVSHCVCRPPGHKPSS